MIIKLCAKILVLEWRKLQKGSSFLNPYVPEFSPPPKKKKKKEILKIRDPIIVTVSVTVLEMQPIADK